MLRLLLAVLAGAALHATGDAPPVITANPNLRAAGTLTRDTLRLRLVASVGRWFPEDSGGPSVDIQAFGEEGRAPSIPGPLVRVREGTVIVASIRNDIPGTTLVVRGFQRRPAAAEDTLQVAVGATRTVRFEAGAPGTYLYWATTTDRPQDDREGLDGQLSGAFVVDPRTGPRPRDRVFVMGAYTAWVDSARGIWREALVINGKSWPYTEHLGMQQDDSVEWRWINANDRVHPMHMHGFFYEVLSLGRAMADTSLAPGERPFVVTQRMAPWSTMRMRFVPHTPGTWVFHCHIMYHIESPGLAPDPADTVHATGLMRGMSAMRGLILALDVHPRGRAPALAGPMRHMRVLVQERPRVYGDTAGYGFVLQDGAEPAPDSVAIPGSPLVLTRGELTAITVVNHLTVPTAVHWHGMELPSYYDGVTGLSGNAAGRAPSIAPGDSFTAYMQPPRAGTFIYHTHLNDIRQASRGLYGALIVLEPGQRWDPATDIILLHSQSPLLDDGPPLLNGRASGHPPIAMRAGVHHRLRLIGFPVAPGRVFAVVRGDSALATWRALAKDGADLPPALATERPARQRVVVGETYDFDFVPRAGDTLRLEMRNPDDSVLIRVPIVVR